MTAIEYPGFWLGPLGGLVALPGYVGSVSTTREHDISYTKLLGGGLVGSVATGRPMRSWSVSIPSADPDELGGFRELLEADPYGLWWFVHPHARATNLLTPRMCDFPALLPGGMRPTVEGDRVVRSWLVGPGRVIRTGPVPVIRGVPVTGSAWLQGGTDARVGLEFLDLAGNVMGMRSTLLNPNPGAMERVHVTADVPFGAVSVNLYVTQPVTFARPAVSWTTGPTEWGPGAGASAVNVAGWSSDLVKAVFDPAVRLRREDISFTVQEVRDA